MLSSSFNEFKICMYACVYENSGFCKEIVYLIDRQVYSLNDKSLRVQSLKLETKTYQQKDYPE